MRTSQRRTVAALAIVSVLAAAAVLVNHYWLGTRPGRVEQTPPPVPGPAAPTQPAAPPSTAPASAPTPIVPSAGGDPASASTPSEPPPATATAPAPLSSDAAALLLRQGLDRLEAHPLAARADLADALNSGTLPDEQAQQARAALTDLAERTIFSRSVLDGDPCVFLYRFKPGDLLARLVDKELKILVPYGLIMHINGIENPATIQAGQAVKMIQGPFHAVVSKSGFTLDVFLEEPQTRRMVFVRRLKVGIGKDSSTPAGTWRVARGGKLTNAPWSPPSSSQVSAERLLPGDAGYPLGRKGCWISLEGVGDNPYTKADGYGIHGTNEPQTIGQAASLGCIRLADDDIEWLYLRLYETASYVRIVP